MLVLVTKGEINQFTSTNTNKSAQHTKSYKMSRAADYQQRLRGRDKERE